MVAENEAGIKRAGLEQGRYKVLDEAVGLPENQQPTEAALDNYQFKAEEKARNYFYNRGVENSFNSYFIHQLYLQHLPAISDRFGTFIAFFYSQILPDYLSFFHNDTCSSCALGFSSTVNLPVPG
jgi:hypothetical protein